jgi:hypothetical protein
MCWQKRQLFSETNIPSEHHRSLRHAPSCAPYGGQRRTPIASFLFLPSYGSRARRHIDVSVAISLITKQEGGTNACAAPRISIVSPAKVSTSRTTTGSRAAPQDAPRSSRAKILCEPGLPRLACPAQTWGCGPKTQLSRSCSNPWATRPGSSVRTTLVTKTNSCPPITGSTSSSATSTTSTPRKNPSTRTTRKTRPSARSSDRASGRRLESGLYGAAREDHAVLG